MNNISKYPRVLIIYNSRINKEDQHGVSLRGWFGDWPKENLAQIYSGGEVGEEVFCKYNFKLGIKERRFGKYFFKLKDSSIGQSSYPIRPDKNILNINKISYRSLLKNKTGNLLINTGLWELIFKPVLSNDLINFIKDFNPQMIYCQGYSLTFSWLPVMVHKKFNIPVCFQTGDDWPSELYKKTVISFAIRPIVHKAVKSLLKISDVRLANGKLMEKEYEKRYKVSFNHVMMCDSLARFRKVSCKRITEKDTFSIVYSGNLGHGRWRSIFDLCAAAKLLESKGLNILVTTFATTLPHEAVNVLKELNNLQMCPALSHDDLPAYLKGADILFLPEPFDPVMASEIHLSISTKAHLYMMSEKPILLYASPITGIANYAIEQEGWAATVDERNLNKLSEELFQLLTNNEYRKKLVESGLKVVLKNHDEHTVKASFLSLLNEKVVDHN